MRGCVKHLSSVRRLAPAGLELSMSADMMLSQLPTEVLIHIFLISGSDNIRAGLGQSCQRFRQITIDNDFLWKDMYDD